jgi:hypothetical protein
VLEILFIIWLVRKIGDTAGGKGHNPLPFQIAVVVFWFGGEIIGAVVGLIAAGATGRGGDDAGFLCGVYIFALFGALCGAGACFLLVMVLPANRQRGYMDDYDDYRHGRTGPRRRRSRYEDEDEEDRDRRRRSRYRDEEEDRDRRRRSDDRYRE